MNGKNMEYYITKRHEGPDYETFMKLASDFLWEAMRQYIDADASVYINDDENEFKYVIFFDVVRSIEEEKYFIYACKVRDDEEARVVMNQGLINIMGLKEKEMDLAMTYVCEFSILLRTAFIVDNCRIALEEYDPSKPEFANALSDPDYNYIIIPKTPQEIEETVLHNTMRNL